MSRRRVDPPTEADLMRYTNVPIETAAKYLGVDRAGLSYGLRHGQVPIGFYMEKPDSYRGTYCIPPERLIAYVKGKELNPV